MRNIAFNSVSVSLANACVHVANYIVIAVIAAFFGASWQTDAFFLALSFPSFFAGAVVSAVGSVFIPVFAECKISRPTVLGRIVGSTLLYVLAATLLIAVFTGLVANHLSNSGILGRAPLEFQRLVIQQILLLLPVIIIQPLTGVITAFYNSQGTLIYPPLTDAISTFFVLAVIIISRHTLGIYSVPLGFLLGAFLHLMLLLLLWRRFDIRIDWTWKVESELRRSLKLALPLIFGTAALQFGSVITRFLATQLPEGSVTILDYANRIAYGIMELLTSGVLLVILAKWSSDVLMKDADWLRGQVQKVALMVSFVVMPVVGISIALREPLVTLVFQRGNFDFAMTTATASILFFFLLGIPVDSIGRIFVRLFLVWQNTWIIGGLAGIRVILTVFTAYVLMQYMGIEGIALADTIAILVVTIAFIQMAHKRLGNTFLGSRISFTKIILGTLGAFVVARLVNTVLILDFMTLVIGGVIGGIVYVFLLWLMHFEQLETLFVTLKVQLRKSE